MPSTKPRIWSYIDPLNHAFEGAGETSGIE